MQYQKYADTYLLRLEPEEEILAALGALAAAEGILLAEVGGLGALKELEVCVFDTAKKVYYTNTFAQPMELISLTGTITQMDGAPYLHLHAAAGDGAGHVLGGHLKRAVVSATAELTVRTLPGRVGRRYSDAIGLNLLDF